MNMNRQNSNNNNNNRRRGRNNNNSRQQNTNRNGFDYQNQIDNRARGNAAQMLEKYKKLASDAQQNDDRVNAEYFLQFADHYFRVLADFRIRQEVKQEEHQGRRNNRDDNRDDNRDGNDIGDRDNPANVDGVPNGEAVHFEQSEDRPAHQPKRTPRAKRPNPRPHNAENNDDHSASNNEGALDLAVLPPSIVSNSGGNDEDSKPERKPRARRVKPAVKQEIATAAE